MTHPEPLSLYSTFCSGEPETPSIYPQAREAIKQRILDYASDRYRGTTMLVAGDRFIGKSYLVAEAVELALKECLNPKNKATIYDDQRFIIPVYLNLNELFEVDSELREISYRSSSQANSSIEDAKKNKSKDDSGLLEVNQQQNPVRTPSREELEKQQILFIMTKAIHRAICHWFPRSLESTLRQDASTKSAKEKDFQSKELDPTLVESLQTLEASLVNFDEIEALRYSFEQAGLISDSASRVEYARFMAIHYLLDSARMISGKIESEHSDASSQNEGLRSFDLGPEVAATLKAGLSALVGLVTFALTGSTKENVLISAISSLAVAMLTFVASAFRGSVSESRVVASKTIFKRSLSVSSLVRRIPALIQRLRRGNIVPVFILDEGNQNLAEELRRWELLSRYFKMLFNQEACLIATASPEFYHEITALGNHHKSNFFERVFYLRHSTQALYTVIEGRLNG